MGAFTFQERSKAMGNKRLDPRLQFSKWLARWTALYWFFHMTMLTVVLFVEPQSAQYAMYMSIVTSVVMLINIYEYSRNSLTEKALLTLLDKTKMELNLSGKTNTETGSDADESEVSNG